MVLLIRTKSILSSLIHYVEVDFIDIYDKSWIYMIEFLIAFLYNGRKQYIV